MDPAKRQELLARLAEMKLDPEREAGLRAEIEAGNPQPDVLLIADTVTLEGMAQDALAILDDGALRGFKQRAKARAAEFTIDRILPHYLDLYHRALDSSAS